MKRKTKLILIISGSVLLLLISGIFIYLNVYYKAVDVDNYLKSSDTVKVEEIKEGYMFDSASDKALIFYPGAKVDTKAYAPLCFQMAEKGFDVFLLDMPFHFAIFDMNAANDIIKIIATALIMLEDIAWVAQWQLITRLKMLVS